MSSFVEKKRCDGICSLVVKILCSVEGALGSMYDTYYDSSNARPLHAPTSAVYLAAVIADPSKTA